MSIAQKPSFVGDSLKHDIAGAKAADLSSVWISTDTSQIDQSNLGPELIIKDLRDLIEKVILKILFIGDIVGSPGRKALANLLPYLIEQADGVDAIIVNGENAAGGKGLTQSVLDEILDVGRLMS